jgi:YVTN family beta-propeller protein
MTRHPLVIAGVALCGLAADGLGACSSAASGPAHGESGHSSSIAVSADGSAIYVVNADADSVSFLDAHAGKLTREVLLAAAAPQVDATTGRFDPSVLPRALALGPGGGTLYVTGERSGHVYALDAASGTIVHDVAVCSEPIGVLASPDGASVYVACSQDAAVVKLDAATLAVVDRVTCDRKPWALAWSADRTRIYATHLLGPGVSVLAPQPLAVATVWATADGPGQSDPDTTGEDPLLPHGQVRGIYDVLARPGTSEVWVPHMMLGTDTPEPALVFNNTAFPSLSLFDTNGAALARLSVSVVPGDDGAFGDVTSGPHAIAFSPDGRYAYVVDTNSEDVLVVDAVQRVEATLVRPLPGHQPEGIAVSSDGTLYVDERNSGDVAVLAVATSDAGPTVTVASTIPRLTADPMPSDLRSGQRIFFSANSDEMPITQDHWIACATCHIESRSDAVTWLFAEGPRDTPSNAGGVLETGFLFRNAARNKVQDYWQTINAEQGGHFSLSVPELSSDMDSLAHFVNYAIALPTPPSTLDPTEVSKGGALFASLGCPTCHAGTAFTDSGFGNPTLDLSGPIVTTSTPGGVILHDVGTCVTSGKWIDVAMPAETGDARSACSFDTPTLRGVSDSAPYLHDGSAATLADVFRLAPGMVGAVNPAATSLSASDQAAIIAYLQSL